jgi:hypothetical protein
VAFAPAEFTNDEAHVSAGAFAATVNLATGARWLVPQRVMLRYHSPGCGTGDTAVFSRYTRPDEAATDLIRVDPVHRRVLDVRHVTGQFTSAVPLGTEVAAAAGEGVVVVARNGSVRRLAKLSGPAFDLHPDQAGGVDLLSMGPRNAVAAYAVSPTGQARRLADGAAGRLRIAAGRGGHNRLVGAVTTLFDPSVAVLPASGEPEAVSLDGSVIVDRVEVGPAGRIDQATVRSHGPSSPRRSDRVTSTPTAASTVQPLATVSAANVSTPKCAIPKGDYHHQVLQPLPTQVEWAAHRAVRGLLTITRPANWMGHGLTSYVPNSLFPRTSALGSAHIPVQVLEGVLAQEANFNQAGYGALPGVAADPLIADYFGTVYDASGHIVGMDYNNADCGYGIAQITDGMTATSTLLSALQKATIAYDYTANMARAVQVLEQKWAELQTAGIIANNGDPTSIENWYLTLWDYNTGMHAKSGSGPWGLGWTNNPANADYPPTRLPFLRQTYDDAAHPGRWPYQEKVLGWAEHGQLDVHGDNKYTPSGLLSLSQDYYLFCKPTSNECDPTYVNSSNPSLSYCTRADRECWWHDPVAWLTDTNQLHPENTSSYVSGQAEPATSNPQPPDCTPTAAPIVDGPNDSSFSHHPVLPSGAAVVDDLPNTQYNLVGCGASASAGSFTLTFASDPTTGAPLSRIDFHQLGTGYGGHFWYAHTVDPTRTAMVVTGTWTPPANATGWQRIYVHIPVTGADTFQANYKIDAGTGKTYHRVVNQRWNESSWVDLGSFNLASGAHVSLSNVTYGDWRVSSAIDIAWDALAFVPSSKPAVAYVALGDSYASGEGLQPYYPNSDNGASTPNHVNACHRSPSAYPSRVAQDLDNEHLGEQEFHFLACSGATTQSLLGNAALGLPLDGSDQRWGEVPQLLQGWLDENTTNVTVEIGGNDVGFAYIILGCILTVQDCTSDNFYLTRGGVVDPQPLIDWEPQVIASVQQPLRQTLSRIRELAPNATIAVVNYPHVIQTAELRAPTPPCQLLFPDTVSSFANWADLLDEQIQIAADAVPSIRVAAVHPGSAFDGHEACSIVDERINALIDSSSSGSGDNVPGTGSFHPKLSGHQAEESVILGALS